MSRSSEVRRLLRAARMLGFAVERRSKHWRLTAADGRVEVVGSTPRDATISALMRLLRRFRERRRA